MMLRILSRLIVAAWLIFAATTVAHADPISILILGFIGISATPFAVAITTFALSMAASIGLSYLAKALAPKPSMPDISSLPGGTTGKLQTGGAVPRTWLAGRTMTAGSLAYANTYSPSAATTAAASLSLTTAAAGNTPNAYLVQVIPVSDIPITALISLFVGSLAATYNSGATPSFEGIAIPEFTVSGKEHLWLRFYDGTQVAADPQLVALFGTDPDRPYTSARIGTGVAYVVVTSLVNQDKFPSFPQCKFVLDGVKLYDRRYDTSVGGSGSQRWATPSTWALTSNPTVIAENILRGVSYGSQWVYGAQTVTETQLPFASWTAAASECDTAITLAAGGTEVQFKAGGEIRFDVEPAATLEELLKACNGRLAEIGGTYKVRAGAAGSAVFSFTDGDILSTEQQTFDPFPSLGQTINAVKGKYISPAEGWVAKDAPPLYDATLETADGGRRLPVDINYSFVTSGTQVQRLMRAARDSHRAMRGHALPMPPEAFVLEPLDVVSWTSTRNGYSSKLFDIETAEDLPNLNMGLAIREIDPNAYDWVAATDEQPVTDGTIVLLRPPAQPIVSWSAVPWTITSDGIQSKPGIKLGWDAATDDVNGVAIEIRRAADSVIVYSNSFADADLFARGSIVVSQGLVFSTAYQARGRYLPISVRDTDWSAWENVTTYDIKTTVTALDDALNKSITTQLAETQALFDDAKNLIASLAADQDASNWIDRRSTRTAISASFGTSYAAIISEEALRVGADSALAVRATNLETSVNDPTTGLSTRASASDVTALESLTGDATHGNLALAARTLSVEANFGGPSSSWTVTITIASPAVVSRTSHALTAGRRIKFATTGALPTGITAGNDYYVIAAGLTANAFEFSATFGGSAVVTSGTQSGTHTVIANDVTSDLSAVSAAGTFRTVASAGSGGALALVDLQVSASVGATFASAGIQIAAYVDGAGSPFSRLRFYADRTEIGIPGITGGDYFAPFTVDYVSGVQQIALRPEALPDGVVKQRALEENIFGTTYYATGSDTTKTENEWNNSGSGATVLTTTLNLTAGVNVRVSFNMMMAWNFTAGNSGSGWIKLIVGGSTVRTYNYIPSLSYHTSAYAAHFAFDEIIANVAGGSTTVKVDLYMNGTTAQTRTTASPKFIIQELPKSSVVDASFTPSISYRTTIDNGTSTTFSGADIGSADANRVVVVAAGWVGAAVAPSLTVGGVAAIRIGWTPDGWGNGTNIALFSVSYPTGTTANIVFSNGYTPSNIYISIWKVVASSATPQRSAVARTDPDGTTYGVSLWDNNASIGEIAIGAVYGASTSATYSTFTMSGETPTSRTEANYGSRRMKSFDLTRATSGSKYFNVSSSDTGAQPIVGITARWK